MERVESEQGYVFSSGREYIDELRRRIQERNVKAIYTTPGDARLAQEATQFVEDFLGGMDQPTEFSADQGASANIWREVVQETFVQTVAKVDAAAIRVSMPRLAEFREDRDSIYSELISDIVTVLQYSVRQTTSESGPKDSPFPPGPNYNYPHYLVTNDPSELESIFERSEVSHTELRAITFGGRSKESLRGSRLKPPTELEPLTEQVRVNEFDIETLYREFSRGMVSLREGRYLEASRFFADAVPSVDELGDHPVDYIAAASCRLLEAQALQELSHPGLARESAADGLEIIRAVSDKADPELVTKKIPILLQEVESELRELVTTS